jgi:hypothetical protein
MDYKMTVLFESGRGTNRPGPNLYSSSGSFEAGSQISSCITAISNASPSPGNARKEGGVEEPRVFEAEILGFGDGCGDGGKKRSVIRGRAS